MHMNTLPYTHWTVTVDGVDASVNPPARLARWAARGLARAVIANSNAEHVMTVAVLACRADGSRDLIEEFREGRWATPTTVA